MGHCHHVVSSAQLPPLPPPPSIRRLPPPSVLQHHALALTLHARPPLFQAPPQPGARARLWQQAPPAAGLQAEEGGTGSGAGAGAGPPAEPGSAAAGQQQQEQLPLGSGAGLGAELDGLTHGQQQQRFRRRQVHLRRVGMEVVRAQRWGGGLRWVLLFALVKRCP